MKTFHLILYFLFFSAYSFGQGTKIDSLLSLLKTDSQDTNKLIHLYNLSDEYEIVGNYPNGLKYGNQALALADVILNRVNVEPIQLSAKRYKAKAYYNIGLIYNNQLNYIDALKNYFACLKIREEIGDKNGITNTYNNIGIIYKNQGNYSEALKNHFASLKIREEIGDKGGIADSYYSIGYVYYYQGNYPEALKNYFASLKINEEIDNKRGIADSYNNIGSVYNVQGNYLEALKNYLASFKIGKAIGDKGIIANSYNNMAPVGQFFTNGYFNAPSLAQANHYVLVNKKDSINVDTATVLMQWRVKFPSPTGQGCCVLNYEIVQGVNIISH